MLGTVNSPHTQHLAWALSRRGVELRLAGDLAEGFGQAPSETPWTTAIAGRRLLSRRGFPLLVRWLRQQIAEARPQLIHAHGLSGYAFAAACASRLPLIGHAWGSDVLAAHGYLRTKNRLTVRRADLLLVDSAPVREALVLLGAPPDRVRMMSWGVDLSLFTPVGSAKHIVRRNLGLPDRPTVLSPRLLKPNYNVALIAEACERARESIPELFLVVKYLGERSVTLPREQAEMIRFVGNVPYEDMPSYYQASDVCVSLPSSDSAPRSVWEAMACGCPCILSDLPWISGALDPDRDALVVPIEVDALAGALVRVLSSPALSASLAEHGRTRVERDQNADDHADQLRSYYDEVLAAERAR